MSFFFFLKKWPIPSFLKVLSPLSYWVDWVIVSHWLNFCLRVTITMLKNHNQSTLKIKGFIWLTYPESRSIEGNQGRNSNQEGTWRKELIRVHGRVLLLTGLFLIACSTCFLTPPRTTTKSGTTYRGLGLPHQSLIKKMHCRLAWSYGGIFLWGSPSQITLACIKVT